MCLSADPGGRGALSGRSGGRLIAEIVWSNPAKGMDRCSSPVLCR